MRIKPDPCQIDHAREMKLESLSNLLSCERVLISLFAVFFILCVQSGTQSRMVCGRQTAKKKVRATAVSLGAGSGSLTFEVTTYVFDFFQPGERLLCHWSPL